MFKIHSKYNPAGDQPKAIEDLVNGINKGYKHQTLLGATGTGKTFTMANVIEKLQKPTLVLAHNKTLAGQLYSELKELFPENAVEYFVSYYDYYQPESYIAATDTYIEKDSSINDEIDKLRHSATAALFERKDVIIVASVSAIYSLGSKEDYSTMVLSIRPDMEKSREQVIKRLIEMQYERNEIDFSRGKFRVKGDVLDIYPVQGNHVVRIEFFGDVIEKISLLDTITMKVIATSMHEFIYPKSHYAIEKEKVENAVYKIKKEMEEKVKYFKEKDMIVESYRLEQRTNFDMEMLMETGFCSGIENYSFYMSNRKMGEAPYTLIDYFDNDFLVIIDESHVTVPQIRAMYNGDRARKTSLIENGFRLDSAYENRPLNFKEFEEKCKQCIYVSATPSEYELNNSKVITEQIIRPTGLLDPKITVKPKENQIDDLIKQIEDRISKNERVLITTLTKKQAEELTTYLSSKNIKVSYMHSDVKALERLEIIKNLRLGNFDVLVGINLLREGLDLPEVSLVAILDSDKQGFLRSESSLIQTIGRAARNSNGEVIMYADELTASMEKAINETNRRRKVQEEYNKKNNIVPKTIKKDIRDSIKVTYENAIKQIEDNNTNNDIDKTIDVLTKEMMECAKKYEFEKAASIRDFINQLKG